MIKELKEIDSKKFFEVFEKVYNKFNNKDYWMLSYTIENKIKERKYYLDALIKADKSDLDEHDLKATNKTIKEYKEEYTEEYIKNYVQSKNYDESLLYCKNLINWIENKEIEFLKENLRSDQKFSVSFVNTFYNIKLTNNTSIKEFINNLKGSN